MLVRFIACRYLVMVKGRSVILKLGKKLVRTVAERVLSETSVILWIGEILYINKCPTRCNNKKFIFYFTAISLYMFRVPSTPIIRNT